MVVLLIHWFISLTSNRDMGENPSDFSSDLIIRCLATLGVVAASAWCWSPVFAGAE